MRTGPRAQVVYPFHYLAESVVARLHFEYARVSRRGAGTFELTQNGDPLIWGLEHPLGSSRRMLSLKLLDMLRIERTPLYRLLMIPRRFGD